MAAKIRNGKIEMEVEVVVKKMVPLATYRVEIANDVIARIESKNIIAKGGNYLGENLRHLKAAEFQALLQKQERPCEVCALGALLIPHVAKFDSFSTCGVGNGGPSRGKVEKALEPIFGKKQLAMIELAFESSGFSDTFFDGIDGPINIRNFPKDLLTKKEIVKCHDFGVQFDTNEERQLAIMKNIVRNKGTFKP